MPAGKILPDRQAGCTAGGSAGETVAVGTGPDGPQIERRIEPPHGGRQRAADLLPRVAIRAAEIARMIDDERESEAGVHRRCASRQTGQPPAAIDSNPTVSRSCLPGTSSRGRP
jgi:hypothetical protein